MIFADDKKLELHGKPNCLEWVSRPQETSCIQAPVILSQIQMRKSVTRNISLMPSPNNDHPSFTLKGTEGFKIIDFRVLNKNPLKEYCNDKRVDLLVVIRYNLLYSDGFNDLIQPDEVCFELSIDTANYPDCNVKLFKNNIANGLSSVSRTEETYFTVDALAETFGEVICSYTGALIIDLGIFFIIKSERVMQLMIPSFS